MCIYILVSWSLYSMFRILHHVFKPKIQQYAVHHGPDWTNSWQQTRLKPHIVAWIGRWQWKRCVQMTFPSRWRECSPTPGISQLPQLSYRWREEKASAAKGRVVQAYPSLTRAMNDLQFSESHFLHRIHFYLCYLGLRAQGHSNFMLSVKQQSLSFHSEENS